MNKTCLSYRLLASWPHTLPLQGPEFKEQHDRMETMEGTGQHSCSVGRLQKQTPLSALPVQIPSLSLTSCRAFSSVTSPYQASMPLYEATSQVVVRCGNNLHKALGAPGSERAFPTQQLLFLSGTTTSQDTASLEMAANPDTGWSPGACLRGSTEATNLEMPSVYLILSAQFSHQLREDHSQLHLLFNTLVTNPRDFPVCCHFMAQSLSSFLKLGFPS